MHLFLRSLFLIPLSALTLAAEQVGDGVPLELCILHTNDTHSHVAGINSEGDAAYSEEGSRGGYARIATAIETLKAKADNVIALDAGDQCQGTLFYNVNKTGMLSDINQHMPYDAAVLGNHEFDEGCGAAAEFTRRSPYPILAANLLPTGSCAMGGSKTQPYIIREIRGSKVGIIGLSNDEVVEVSHACRYTRFEDASATLRRIVAELEAQGVRHIVLLTHLGLEADRRLARSVAGVDVIVGGHSHDYLGEGAPAGSYPLVESSPAGQPVLIVTAKSAGQYLGQLHVCFDAEGAPASWSGSARELEASIPPKPEISSKVKHYAQTLVEYREKLITVNNNAGADGMDECRRGETLTALVVADAALDYGKAYGAEIAFMNAGGIRAALPKGRVSRGDVMAVMPFNGSFPVLEMTGAQIRAALEHGVSEGTGQGPALLHVAGMSYRVDASQPAGSRVCEVQVAGALLDEARTYRVAMPDYIAGGGDGYSMMPACKQVKTPLKSDAKVLEDYLRRFNPLPMPQPGRLIYR